MGFTASPTVVTVGEKKHAISFTFQFTTPANPSIPAGGSTFAGELCRIDVNSLKTPANIGPIKCVQFSQSFAPEDNTDVVGSLIISVPSSGQFAQFAPPYELIGGVHNRLVCGIVPVVCNSPSVIDFIKTQNFGGALEGVLTATLFDFDLPPYISYGSFGQN